MTLLENIVRSRNLTKMNQAVRRLMSGPGEANSSSMAHDVIRHYSTLDHEGRVGFYTLLAEKFNPSPNAVLEAATAYAGDSNAQNLIKLTRAAESPRQELLRRINRASEGTKIILTMRREILKLLDKRRDLAALDYDIRHLLSSWFNPGFLKMHRVDWNSPALVLEKIIHHEAVHAIDGWDDLRRRLLPDRRCFAFFHPQLPNEPLIFVEVALLAEIPNAIGPLVDKQSTPSESSKFKTAVFYSISNCEPGLRGVSLGNFLIKRVADQLKAEFPSLKTFVTLSPIPGFVDWISKPVDLTALEQDAVVAGKFDKALRQISLKGKSVAQRVAEGWLPSSATDIERDALQTLCAIYLIHFSTQRSGSPVAKFHLGNGARLYRLNWAADLSKKGLKESAGLMVNYLYDLDEVEANHEKFNSGEVVRAKSVDKLV
jgi:malonyl-CoA decarboxylase